MIYCANCGTGLSEESGFCFDCGATIIEIPISQAIPVSHNNSAQVQRVTYPKLTSESESNHLSQDKSSYNNWQLIHCRNCSNTLNPMAFACTKCGLPPFKGKSHCQCCGAETHPEAVVCIKCGVMLETEVEKKVVNASLQPVVYYQQLPQQLPPQINTPQSPYIQQNITIIGKQKSVGSGVALAFFFGPLGLLYATITGGLIMIGISIIVGILTIGVGAIVTWVVSVIWAVIAANAANSRIK